jgi:hypothetical protein
MRPSIGRLAVAFVFLFVCLTPRSAAAFNSRTQIDASVEEFKLLQLPDGVSFADDCCIAYVLGTNQNLWREDFFNGHRTQVDAAVIDFQPWDGNTVYVLGSDRKLWREFGSGSNRTLVDAAVASFHAIDGNWVYVLGTDGNLWLEDGTAGNRSQVASGVQKFQPFNDGSINWSIYVLYKTANLFYAAQSLVLFQFQVNATTPIQVVLNSIPPAINGNVADFNAVDLTTTYLLGTDGALWRERGSASNRDLVDTTVQSFVPLNTKEVLVLGTDQKLWRELGNSSTRDNVDSNVFVDSANPHVPYFAWQANSSDPTVFVLGSDRKLWDEGMPTSLPYTCVPKDMVKGSGQCCADAPQTNQVGRCEPADPGGCGIPYIGGAPPCCRNSTPCIDNSTCVVDKTTTPPYAYCTINPPAAGAPPLTSMQTGGNPNCPSQVCKVYCEGYTGPDVEIGLYGCDVAGLFCSDALAKANADAIFGTTDCIACCGAECENPQTPGGYYCNSAANE